MNIPNYTFKCPTCREEICPILSAPQCHALHRALKWAAVLDCNSAHIKAIARVGEEAIGGMIFGKKIVIYFDFGS